VKAYNQGYSAFVKGDLSNPYPSGDYSYKEWERGFNAAYFYNLKRIESGRKTKKKAPSA